MVIYGSMLCPDCVRCREDLDKAGIRYEYREITENLQYLKEFLHLRDTEALFSAVKQEGKIGIPCIVDADGGVRLDWN